MSFPDIKLIIILFLSIVVFFMYREIMNIKTKLNTLYLSHKNIKSNPSKEFIDEEFIDNINEIFQKNEQFPNFSLSHNNDFPILNNIFGGCIIKTISIPLDSYNHPDIIEMNPDIIEMNPDIIEMDNIMGEYALIQEVKSEKYSAKLDQVDLEHIDSPFSGKILSEHIDSPYSGKILSEHIESPYSGKILSENIDSPYSGKILSEHIESPYSGKILSEHIDSPYSGKILSEHIDILPNESTSNHTEIYSNDESVTNSSVITSSIQQKTNNEKINDYNKMKLPEVQDLAISYKISLQNNNKKKTKTELITDIKKYLLNKNI